MDSSRRNFLVAGIGLPAIASASRSASPEPQAPAKKRPSDIKFEYRVLGKTGLKVTTVGFGCMVTSDGSVIERAADMGITYFDTARVYSEGNNERMVGAALKGKRNSIMLSSKTHSATRQEALNDLDTSLKELGTDHLDIWYLHAKDQAGRRHRRSDRRPADRQKGRQDPLRRRQHPRRPARAGAVARQESQHRCHPERLQLHPGACRQRGSSAGRRGRQGRRGHEGDGRRFPHLKPRRPRLRQAQAGRRLAGGPEVGHAQPQGIHTTVPSITDNDQLEENIKAMRCPSARPKRSCWPSAWRRSGRSTAASAAQCEGACRQGLPVADMLRILTYADGYGQFALGREHFL